MLSLGALSPFHPRPGAQPCRVRCSYRVLLGAGALYCLAMYCFHAILDSRGLPPLPRTDPDHPKDSQSFLALQEWFRARKMEGTTTTEDPDVLETFFLPDPIQGNLSVAHVSSEVPSVGPGGMQSDENIPEECRADSASQPDRFQSLGRDIHLYSAFWDERPNDFDNLHNGTYVRVMAIVRNKVTPQLECLFTTPPGASGDPGGAGGGSGVLRAPVTYYEMCENHNRGHGGFILSCAVPQVIARAPCTVRVSFKGADVTLALRTLAPATPPPRNFTICVPPLFGDVSLSRLVEFIETSVVIGANHVVFYLYNTSPGVQALLARYAKKTAYVSVVPWALDNTVDIGIWYHGQLVAIQDCLYRSMALSRYVAFNDIDEYVVPHNATDWWGMVRALDAPLSCAFQFHSAFYEPHGAKESYFPEVGLSLHTMSALERTVVFSRIRAKCMVRPTLIFEKGIHHISKPIWASLVVTKVEREAAFLHHYRKCTPNLGMRCDMHMVDETMLRYKSGLIAALHVARRNVLRL